MKLHKIRKLYEQIHICNRCFGALGCEMKPDVRKVQRKVVKRAIESEVVIIGQALGGNTQRLSGLPYVSINGQLSRTGQILDNFLNSFGYTINPLSSLKYVYSSDIVQCYPGRLTRGDRKPTEKEIENCFIWLDNEFSLVAPTVVLLLGSLSSKHFFKKYFNLTIREMQDTRGRKYHIKRKERHIGIFAVPHPAYRSRNPKKVDKIYEETGLQVREIF